MQNSFLLQLGLALAIAGCGGNVSVGTSGDGGNGGAGGGTTTSTGTPTNDFAACTGPGQCVLAITNCCGPCGTPEIGDYAAVNQAQLGGYQKFVCPEETPCPACAAELNPHLFAYCDAGQCVAADARTHAVSACTSSDDCYLRVGTDCCESCGPISVSQLTAVTNAMPQIEALVCAPDTGCAECGSQLPPEALTLCGVSGHCEVVISDDGT